MCLFATIGLSLALLALGVTPCWAEEARQAKPQGGASQTAPEDDNGPLLGEPESVAGDSVLLGPPETVPAQDPGPRTPAPTSILPLSVELGPPTTVFRGQAPDPAASPFGVAPGGIPPPPGPSPGTNPADCGIPSDGKQNFWDRFCEHVKDCGKNVFGSTGDMFKTSPGHKPFESDHDFEMFTSPVSNPFFMLDPRSLTEVKPVFIYQQTRNSNPIFAGGSNYFVGLQGSLALTEWISIKFSEFGVDFMEPRNPTNNPLFGPNVGISEFHVGPQITFIRNKDTRTLLAAGLTFEIPWGSEKTFQHTGTLGVVPYISFAQNFWKTNYGSVNFMNTTGWAGGAERSDFFFSSFHLDYNVLNQDKLFPMFEVNWAHYTNSGNQTPVNFEGWDLYNFGAHGVAGSDSVTLNFVARYKINSFWQVGGALGFSPIGGGNQLDAFRLTVDMIFRY